MNTIIFACSTLRKELLAAMKENNNHTPIFFLPREVHTDPKFLHTYVQDKIDRFCQVDRIRHLHIRMRRRYNRTHSNYGGNCDSTDTGLPGYSSFRQLSLHAGKKLRRRFLYRQLAGLYP